MVYNLEDLRKEYNEGKTYKFLFFWGHIPSPDGDVRETCFSQWWPCHFLVEGTDYCCTEQFMMAEKARLFKDEEMLCRIMESVHPKEMKAYGRAVKNFDKDMWDKACIEVVKRGNQAKFSQNPRLLKFLLGTKNRILVEASPRDCIWGIGMGRSNPDAENPLKWKGKNLLGFALTDVRDGFLKEETEEA